MCSILNDILFNIIASICREQWPFKWKLLFTNMMFTVPPPFYMFVLQMARKVQLSVRSEIEANLQLFLWMRWSLIVTQTEILQTRHNNGEIHYFVYQSWEFLKDIFSLGCCLTMDNGNFALLDYSLGRKACFCNCCSTSDYLLLWSLPESFLFLWNLSKTTQCESLSLCLAFL